MEENVKFPSRNYSLIRKHQGITCSGFQKYGGDNSGCRELVGCSFIPSLIRHLTSEKSWYLSDFASVACGNQKQAV